MGWGLRINNFSIMGAHRKFLGGGGAGGAGGVVHEKNNKERVTAKKSGPWTNSSQI